MDARGGPPPSILAMVRCCRRRVQGGSDADDDWLLYDPDGSRRGRSQCMLRVTVTNMAGASIESCLPVDAPFQELLRAVKEAWSMPLPAQRFVLAGQVVNAKPGAAVGRALGHPEGGEVELTCVRTAMPYEEQRKRNEALLLAAARGDCGAIDALVADGAKPQGYAKCGPEEVPEGYTHEASDAFAGRTPSPLLLAVVAEHEEAAEKLRSLGASEPELDPRSWDIGRAMGRSHFADVARLLRAKADPNQRLHRGEGVRDTTYGCPLHACCAQHSRPGAAALAELLLQLGANPTEGDSEGDSPLAHAKYFGADNVAEVLKVHGAKVVGPYYSTLFTAQRRIFGMR